VAGDAGDPLARDGGTVPERQVAPLPHRRADARVAAHAERPDGSLGEVVDLLIELMEDGRDRRVGVGGDAPLLVDLLVARSALGGAGEGAGLVRPLAGRFLGRRCPGGRRGRPPLEDGGVVAPASEDGEERGGERYRPRVRAVPAPGASGGSHSRGLRHGPRKIGRETIGERASRVKRFGACTVQYITSVRARAPWASGSARPRCLK